MADFDFSLLSRAGVSQGEFGSLVGVSRVTVNLWTRGQMPNRFLQAKVKDTLARINKALEKELLPLAAHVKRGKAHQDAIAKALAQIN